MIHFYFFHIDVWKLCRKEYKWYFILTKLTSTSTLYGLFLNLNLMCKIIFWKALLAYFMHHNFSTWSLLKTVSYISKHNKTLFVLEAIYYSTETKIGSQPGHISDKRLKRTPVNIATLLFKASLGNSGLEHYISRAQIWIT